MSDLLLKDIESFVDKKIKPLKEISTIINKDKINLIVNFLDGSSYTVQLNENLRLFLTTLKDTSMKFYEGEDCIKEQLNYYAIFGCSVGDKLALTNEDDIMFNVQLI